jgi:hypothetical protein
MMNSRSSLSEIVSGPIASGISAGCALVAAVGFYLCAKNESPEVTIDLLATFNIGILFYIAFEQFMKNFHLREMADINRVILETVESMRTSLSLTERISVLSHEYPLISYVARDTLTSFLVSFEVARNGKCLTLQGSDMTVAALVGFWEWAVKLQKSFPCKALTVRVTHSNGIGLYSDRNNPVTLQLYALQREFIKSGGRVFRILIEDASTSYHRRLNDYMYVMHRMEEIGVTVAYIPLYSHDDKDGLERLNHDLLLFDPDMQSISWTRERDYTPRSCVISAEVADYEVHQRTWRALIDRLINHGNSGSANEYSQYVSERRSEFLAALPQSDLTP